MIRRSPAETFLKYTMLKHPKRSVEDIIEDCRALQLDWVGPSYLTSLREGLRPPKPFRMSDRNHVPSFRYLLLEGLVAICFQDKDAKLAFVMLKMPRVKEFIEAMSLSGAPDVAISRSLNRENMVLSTPESVARYRSFFWNLALVDSTETRALLDMRVEQLLQSPRADVQAQYSSVRKAYWNDPRRIAADLPTSPFTAAIAQIKAGVLPQGIDRSKLLENTITVLSLRVLECSLNNGPKDSMKATEYANALRIIQEVKTQLLPPQQEFETELRAISLQYNNAPLRTVQELPAGSITTQVVPEDSLGDTGVGDADEAEDILDTEGDGDGQDTGAGDSGIGDSNGGSL